MTYQVEVLVKQNPDKWLRAPETLTLEQAQKCIRVFAAVDITARIMEVR